jgi:hypothetical protein
VLRLAGAKVEVLLDLDFQNAAASAFGEAVVDLERAGGGVFCPLHDLENVAPRQLRNRLLRNWVFGETPGQRFSWPAGCAWRVHSFPGIPLGGPERSGR